MSLVPHPEMTEKNLEAHRSNGRKSRGAATAAGKERARAANLRHGFYSQISDEALEALGEDPAVLAALIEGAHEQWRPANSYQAGLAERLARLQWRMDRAERRQVNLEVQHIRQVERRRRERVGPIRDHYLDMVNFLACVQHDVLRPDFYASPGYIHKFTKAFADGMNAQRELFLEFLHRLGKPQTPVAAPGPLPPEAINDSSWAETLRILEEMGEEDFPLPHPEIPVAEGEERAEIRAELRAMAASEEATTEAAWAPYFDENWRPFTTAQRDVLLANPELSSQRELARREESSCFREFWRLGTILTNMQKQAEVTWNRVRPEVGPNGVRPESEARGPRSEVTARGFEGNAPPGTGENVGASDSAVAAISDRRRRGAPEERNMRRSLPASGQAPTAATAGAEQVGAAPATHAGQAQSPATGGNPLESGKQGKDAENQRKNEGTSGDVAENKGGAKAEPVADAPAPAAHSAENVPPASPDLPQATEMAL